MEIASPEVLLADTSFLGHYEASRARPDEYRHWPPSQLDRLQASHIAISPFTLAELRYGWRKGRWGAARVAAAEHTLAGYLLVPLDERTIDTYVDLKLSCVNGGKAIGDHDCWIAATALSREIPLISCDRAHRDLPGLETIFLPPPS